MMNKIKERRGRMTDLKNKRILSVATTGAWPSKEDNPKIPLQPHEIAEEIYKCWQIGASVAHVHVRDADGNDTMEVGIFKEVLDTLRNQYPECDIIINLTAAGGIGNSEEERLAPFQTLKPEMASFDCGTMNWMHMGVFNNNPNFLRKMGKAMLDSGVKPEIEVFSPSMIYEAKYYFNNGFLEAPLHFQFCMGVAGGMTATAENLVLMKNVLDKELPGSTWSAFGVGRGSMEVLYTTVALGGHVRVGMEDNIMYSRGVLAESNMQLVARAKRVIEEFGNELATPDEARKILGLNK